MMNNIGMGKAYTYNASDYRKINILIMNDDLKANFKISSTGKENNAYLKIYEADKLIHEGFIKTSIMDISPEDCNKSYPESSSALAFGLKDICTDDLAKYKNWDHSLYNLLDEASKKLERDLISELPFYELLKEITEKQVEINKDVNIIKINRTTEDTGISFNDDNSYSVLIKSNISPNSKIIGNSYTYNSKINQSEFEGICIDSFIDNSKSKASIFNGVCLLNSITSNCIIGNGKSVVLIQDRKYKDQLGFKVANGNTSLSDLKENTAKELIGKFFRKITTPKIFKTAMLSLLLTSGMTGIAFADNTNLQNTKPSAVMFQNLSQQAMSAGINYKSIESEQLQNMNVDQLVQRDDKGIVVVTENHSNKLIQGVGYLTEDGSYDKDYTKISLNKDGKSYTIQTNFEKAVVSKDSNILGWNEDVPYLTNHDALKQVIQEQAQTNKLAQQNKSKEVERA